MTRTNKVNEASAPDGSVKKNHDTNWGVFAYVALGLVSVALVWSLILQSMLVDQSNRTVDRLAKALHTSQVDYQQTAGALQREANQSRASLQTELGLVRQQTAATISALTKLASASSTGWQNIARTAVANVSASSQQAIGLLEATLRQVQGRTDAAAAAAKIALARAQAVLARVGSRSANRAAAAAAAVTAALRNAQAVGQRLITEAQSRLNRLQAAINYVIEHLPLAKVVQPAIRAALVDLSSAATYIAGALSWLTSTSQPRRVVPKIQMLIAKATPALDRAAALVAAVRVHPAAGAATAPSNGTPAH